MTGMRELLEEMVAAGASDLHITAGLPPQFRIDGKIGNSNFPGLDGDDTRRLAYIGNAAHTDRTNTDARKYITARRRKSALRKALLAAGPHPRG